MDDPARGPLPAPPPTYGADRAPYGGAQLPRDAADPGAAPVTARKPRKISIPGIVIGLTMLGSIAFIGYVVLRGYVAYRRRNRARA